MKIIRFVFLQWKDNDIEAGYRVTIKAFHYESVLFQLDPLSRLEDRGWVKCQKKNTAVMNTAIRHFKMRRDEVIRAQRGRLLKRVEAARYTIPLLQYH